MDTPARALLPWFRAALAGLVLAAATGALLRGALVWGWDLGASLVHVRHAHSHTMYFAWITPALFLLMSARAGVTRRTVHAIGIALVLGAATHPLFLRLGYESADVLGARLPLAAVVSGLAVLSWYAFVALFLSGSRAAPRSGALLAWRLALALLVFSTLAVWPLALIRPLGLDPSRWSPVLSHAFLDPFSEGFLVLAVLGLAHAEADRARPRRAALVVLAVSAPLAFPLGLAHALLPPVARAVACAASIAWGLALLVELHALARALPSAWRAPLALGATAALAKLVAGLTPWVDWSATPGLRILYLHLLLLGFVSLGTLAAARGVLGRRAVPGLRSVVVGAVAMIGALLPISELWPRAWSGGWTGALAAGTAAAAAALFGLTLARSFDRPDLAPRVPLWLSRQTGKPNG